MVCAKSEVDKGTVVPFVISDSAGQELRLAVIRSVKDAWFAVDDRCSHGRFKLSEGYVEDEGIECTRHGAIFDLSTGEPLTPPATEPIKTYPVRVDGQSVYVTI